MSNIESDSHSHGVRAFFGGVLILVGFLMAGLCGLCTVVFVVGGLFGDESFFSGPDIAILALFLGGLPTLIGVGMFAAGRALRKAPPSPRPPAAP